MGIARTGQPVTNFVTPSQNLAHLTKSSIKHYTRGKAEQNPDRHKLGDRSQEQERAQLPNDSRTTEPQHKAEPFSFTGE